ncbi:Hypothetical protein CINCED_3A023283 [Cinara cedri]|nr:Hypothetical protein CINCED_3A023283 [Cinara cedri]
MRYIKECGQTKPNTILQLLYIRSCYASQDQLTDEDQHEIQTICLSILKNNSHLVNSTFMEGIIMGLCCTPLWRNSLEYLNNFKNEKDIKIRAYSCTIFKAFKEEEIDIGWSLIQTMYNQHEILLTSVFAAWFNLCDINKNYSYQKVLEFLRDNECIVRTHLAELIHEKYKQYGSKITTTIIKPDGRCTNCNQILKPVEITNSEFKALQESFMSRVVIGKNIFNNSSPQELNNFKDFIKNTAPYDVVVDGLNVAYAYRGKIANDSLIKIVLKILIKQKSKVLLFGRKHLVQQLGNEFNFIKRNVNIFFADDLSKDDPFLLYAAMYSGIQTKILTRDLMRGHKFLLNNSKMQNIFQKWLQKNRLILKIRPQNEVFIRNPIPYLQTTQESGKGIWHLPYEEIKEPGSWSKPNSSPDNWMCIKTLD